MHPPGRLADRTFGLAFALDRLAKAFELNDVAPDQRIVSLADQRLGPPDVVAVEGGAAGLGPPAAPVAGPEVGDLGKVAHREHAVGPHPIDAAPMALDIHVRGRLEHSDGAVWRPK